MIFCLYNLANNALLGLYDVEPIPAAGQAVQALNRDIPNLATEEWNPAMLRFDMKAGVVLSKREFLKRLTPAEYAGIKAAAASNSTVDFYWQLFMTSENIVLTHPDTVSGVNLLVAGGLLTADRAVEILG